MSKFVAFLKEDTGATAIEYGLVAAGISLAIIVVVNAIGITLNGSSTVLPASEVTHLAWEVAQSECTLWIITSGPDGSGANPVYRNLTTTVSP